AGPRALHSFPTRRSSDLYRGIGKRLAALEYKLQYITGGANEVVITGANLRIVNGLGATETTNGLGNVIVGYNELRQESPDCPFRSEEHTSELQSRSDLVC